MELNAVICQFLGNGDYAIARINDGLINSTFKVETPEKSYILQKINSDIFKNHAALLENHLKVTAVLAASNYPKKLVRIVAAKNGESWVNDEDGIWRMTEFIDDTITFLKVPSADLAFEAAKCLSEFYEILNRKPLELQEVLPGFIDFEKRIIDFQDAIKTADNQYLEAASEEISFLQSLLTLPEKWIALSVSKKLPTRTIHADPKISNILFDKQDKAVAVIDLDTMMNAPILYDFGDMVRSYCNTTNEDDASTENNFSLETYQAVKAGFLTNLKEMLSDVELNNLDYAAKVVVYIQALRFLTDYLLGSVYYKTSYAAHNLDRTKNQIYLLKNLMKNIHEI